MIKTFGLTTKAGKSFRFDMDLDLTRPSDAWIDQHFMQGLCYEAEVSHLLLCTVRPGDFVVDVGANLGFFTLVMSAIVGETGRVLAFEPGANNLPALAKNLSLNVASANVRVDKRPLWCREEKVTFWHSADSSGGNCLWNPGLWWENKKSKAKEDKYETVATTLDATVHERPRLIKIDTEGADQKILEGARNLLTHNPPDFIVVELNPFGSRQLGGSNEGFRSYMREFGYELFLLQADGSLPALVPRKSVVTHDREFVMLNVLFSTLDAVGETWSRVPHV